MVTGSGGDLNAVAIGLSDEQVTGVVAACPEGVLSRLLGLQGGRKGERHVGELVALAVNLASNLVSAPCGEQLGRDGPAGEEVEVVLEVAVEVAPPHTRHICMHERTAISAADTWRAAGA